MISVASEMSGESPGSYERSSQLPVQVNICFNHRLSQVGALVGDHI